MRRSLVIGNWKMHGTMEAVNALVSSLNDALAEFDGCGVAVCPTHLHIQSVAELIGSGNIAWGAQNCCVESGEGAFTGEVSAAMLSNLGCQYVLAGHSERRALYAETDEVVAAKCARILEQKMKPVLCLGETLEQREAGHTEQVVERQLRAVVDSLGIAPFKRVVLAYEPVWAIGTGKTATPEQAQAVHGFLRSVLAEYDAEIAEKVAILYGGSVKQANAAELFSQADIDGGLVGGASLNPNEFAAICKAAG